MATNNENNVSRVITQVLSKFVEIEQQLRLDFVVPGDDFTDLMLAQFYNLKSTLCSTNPNEETLSVFLQSCMSFISSWRRAEHYGMLHFEDIDGWERDLTEEGVESNPGPTVHSCARNNRSSAQPTDKMTRVHIKQLKKEHEEYLKYLTKRARGGHKFVEIPEYEYNYAQIGAEYIGVEEEPRRDCQRCGRPQCGCLIKRATLAAALLSAAGSLIKIIETFITLSTTKAQMGLMSYFMPDGTEKLIDSVNQAVDSMPTTEDIVAAVKDIVDKALDSNVGFLPISYRNMFKIVATFAAVYVAYQMGLIAFDMVKFVFNVLTPETDSEVTDRLVSDWFTPRAQIGGQNGFDIVGSLPNIVSFVFSTIVAVCIGCIPGKDNTPTGWMAKLGSFPRACSSFKAIYDYVTVLVKAGWNKFCIDYLGYDPILLEDAIPEVGAWLTEVELYTNINELQSACTSKDLRARLCNLYINGHNLLLKYGPALSPQYKAAMQRMLVCAAKIKTYVESNHPEVGAVRTVPLPIWLVGESQIGKSRLQYLIAAELCMEKGYHDTDSQMYMRCPEQEYWDGYQGQFVTIFDDFGQKRDSSSNPNVELFEMIRCIGPFPYPLHMADLAAKNSTRFTSGVVICSTNNMHLQVNSLTYEEAVWNRLTQSWVVEVKDEFLIHEGDKVRLNLPAVRADRPGWEINPYIYNFRRFDARRRNEDAPFTGEVLQWDEFIRVLREDLRNKIGGGASLAQWLKDYVNNRVEAVAQIGSTAESVSKDVDDVFTRGPRVSVGQFLDWLSALEKDPISGFELKYNQYRVYADMEREELGDKVSSTYMVGYVPVCVPEREWDALFLAYIQSQDGICSRAKRWLKNAASMTEIKYKCMSPKILEACNFIKEVVMGGLTQVGQFMAANPLATAALSAAFFLLLKRQRSFGLAESHHPETQPRSRGTVKVVNKVKAVRVKAEMGQSLGQLSTIASVRKQQWLLLADNHDGSSTPLGCITNIVGTIWIMPMHFYQWISIMRPKTLTMLHPDNDKVRITRAPSDLFEEVMQLQDDNDQPMDVCVFSIINGIRGRSILHHFISNEDYGKIYNREVFGTLSGLNFNPKGAPVLTDTSGKMRIMSGSMMNYKLDCAGDILDCVATGIAEYSIPTKFGDCGKLLSLNNDLIVGKCIGFHVSGTITGRNYGQLFTREMLEVAVSSFPVTAQCGRALKHVHEDVGEPINAGFLHVGELTVQVNQSTKTALEKSQLYGLFGPAMTTPALLKPKEIDGKLHDPLVEGAKKAGRPCVDVQRDILSMAVNDMRIKLNANFKEGSPEVRVLTYEEAIQGIPGDELFEAINRTTSPGFPYMTQLRKGKGKTYWMGHYDYDFESEPAKQLRRDVETIIDKCAKSEPFEVIWIDTLKDERRPIEKVAKGKTRIISNGPMDYNIAFRMYFMAALAKIRYNRIHNGCTIGINCFSKEWDFLAKYLTSNSSCVIDGDFTEFDGSLNDSIMWEIFGLLDGMYNDGNTIIRKNLWYQACYAIRANRGTVYQCTHSLPSGFVATSEANSIYVNIIFRCVYMILARKHAPKLANMESFNANVKMVANGDDNLISIKPTIIEWFNMVSIIEAMKEVGMIYTPASKDGNIELYKGIHDVQYLKRFFKYVDMGCGTTTSMVCPADLPSRLEILYWTTKRADEGAIVSDVLREVALHGRQVYEEYAPKIIRAALDKGITTFVDEGYAYHLMKASSGDSVPCRRDLTPDLQKPNVIKVGSTAVDGRGVDIYPYTLGSPVAAPQYPREH